MRSLAAGSSSSTCLAPTPGPSSSSSREALRSEDLQREVLRTRNESPSAAIPIPRNGEEDLELGDDLADTLVDGRPSAFSPTRGWRALAGRSRNGGESSRSDANDDRSR